MSDEITIHTRPNRSYELLPYDPAWPKKYEELAQKIKPVFGDNLVDMQHCGSTSIPGMIAKPTIDIIVAVKDLEQVRQQRDTMVQLGFRALGNFIQLPQPEEYFVLDGKDANDRIANVHVQEVGNFDITNKLSLRDYLRKHPQDRDAYIQHKLSLMKRYSSADYNSYSSNKNGFLSELAAKAIAWKSQQGSN